MLLNTPVLPVKCRPANWRWFMTSCKNNGAIRERESDTSESYVFCVYVCVCLCVRARACVCVCLLCVCECANVIYKCVLMGLRVPFLLYQVFIFVYYIRSGLTSPIIAPDPGIQLMTPSGNPLLRINGNNINC